MRIAEFLSPQAVVADMQARTKPEVLRELSVALVRACLLKKPFLDSMSALPLTDGRPTAPGKGGAHHE